MLGCRDSSSADLSGVASLEAMTASTAPGRLIEPVLIELADVVGNIRPEQLTDPTPCTEFDVADLRKHVLGWVTYFGAAFADPDGSTDRPDPQAFQPPLDPQVAAELVRTAARQISQAVEDGVAGKPVLVVKSTMPGEMSLRMTLWEYLTHGSDLAKATAQPWNPPAAAIEDALAFAPGMLTDEYRGEGKDFGHRVPVPDDAPPLDKLLGFSGRDPHWKA
jgi:uncharacterized protein (TIGR03086 family)